MYLFFVFLNMSFAKIKYNMIINIENTKLGNLAEKSLIQKREKLIFWVIVKRYCDKYISQFAIFGTKLFRYEKYETIELYHSSIQNDQVSNS